MDAVLVCVDVRAQLHVMAFVPFERFGIHHVPGLLVGIVDEGDFVAVRFHRTRDVQQRRFSIILLRFLGPPGFSRRRT